MSMIFKTFMAMSVTFLIVLLICGIFTLDKGKVVSALAGIAFICYIGRVNDKYPNENE
jgi:hypothetical protein